MGEAKAGVPYGYPVTNHSNQISYNTAAVCIFSLLSFIMCAFILNVSSEFDNEKLYDTAQIV